MYNQFTDRFRFVDLEVIKSAPFWGRKILAKEGYSQQLFRNKEYDCTLRPYDEKTETKPLSVRVYNGDAIYKIDIRPHAIPFVGSFKTKDNFVRTYDFTLVLIVINPVIFAKGYSVGQDPVFLAVDSIHKALVKFGEEHEHDKLSKLVQPALDWNTFLAEDTGVRVDKITKWILHEDIKKLKRAEIEQDTDRIKLLVQREADTQLLRERSDRKRAALEHIYQLHELLSDSAANELKAILQERIRDAFESGETIDKVAKETIDLLNTLYKGIENFSYLNGAHEVKNGASSGTNGGSTRTQASSSKGEGSAPNMSFEMDTDAEGDTMKDPAINIMPAIHELRRKDPDETS
jgi:hypothetical protein